MTALSTESAHSYLADQLDFLRGLVEIESPTTEKSSVDAAGEYVKRRLEALGAEVRRIPQEHVGDHWVGSWGSGAGGTLMMVHLDTVHPIGTLGRLPWSVSGGKAYGPGIVDMKAGAAIALTAIEALRDASLLPGSRISALFTSDEETGSHSSQELIQTQAEQHDLVLCLEPALPNGALKTWRKGVGMFELEVRGRAAHAGANPFEGANAIHEMAHQIQQIVQMADDDAGTTLNVDRVEGGTRTNVIPAVSRAMIDVRVEDEAERDRISERLDGLTPLHPKAQVSLSGEWNRPPMPRTEAIVRTFQRAREIGARLGLELTEGGTGGGSDANFVAPLGVALLDGLGAIGGGAHTEQEYIEIASLPQRTALLAALLTEWQRAQ